MGKWNRWTPPVAATRTIVAPESEPREALEWAHPWALRWLGDAKKRAKSGCSGEILALPLPTDGGDGEAVVVEYW